MNKMCLTVLLAILILIIVSGCKSESPDQSGTAIKYSGEVLLTPCLKIENNMPSDGAKEFSLTDLVYVHAFWKRLSGSHRTTSIFIDPKGQPRFPAEVMIRDAKGVAVTWYWLKISEVNPEWARGKWEVRIFIDDLLAATEEIIIR